MNNTSSFTFFDAIRWLIGLSLIPLIVWGLHWAFLVPFEWMLLYTTKWAWYLHVGFWLIFGVLFITFISGTGAFLALLPMFIVRQYEVFGKILSLPIIGLMIFILLGTWGVYVEYSWTYLPYSIFNKIIFTAIALGLSEIAKSAWNVASLKK